MIELACRGAHTAGCSVGREKQPAEQLQVARVPGPCQLPHDLQPHRSMSARSHTSPVCRGPDEYSPITAEQWAPHGAKYSLKQKWKLQLSVCA